MNRNTELHFSNVPQIDIKRSKFEESHSHKTTFNVGDVVPVYVDTDILPGDTVQMDMAELVRMATPIYPIMDNLYLDIYWFFVPHRLVWNHWAEFWGQNDDPWIQQTEYEIPQITAPEGGWAEGTIADYMGIPTKIGGLSVCAFAFRAYAKIWNDWFRSETLKKNCHIYEDETTRQGTNGTGDYVLDVELGGKPAKVAKLHDYFTSALPSPQRGPEVSIPLGGEMEIKRTGGNNIPVYGSGTERAVTTRATNWPIANLNIDTGLNLYGQQNTNPVLLGLAGSSTPYRDVRQMSSTQAGTPTDNKWVPGNLKIDLPNTTQVATVKNTDVNNLVNQLYGDLTNVTATTISALRTAFAIQRFYENAGRAGTRYIEFIRSVFGVTSSDARFQRAEYLGGQRVPLNIDQIIQTSSTDSTSPQGNAAGFSCTLRSDSMFTKSFEEHGTLMCLICVRTEHTYQQGLDRMWKRKKWVHFYNPYFANLSEQEINNYEIYAQGTAKDDEVFGYQERWAEYRFKQNRVSGYMRSNATGSLDVWHFADDYNALPTLGTTWIDEPLENVDRTIAVTSQLTHQFIGDFFFKTYYTRPMPVYSVPGGIERI